MSRLTGYTYWFYSYSMRLPLWSYYLYDGSIKENVTLIKETLGIFDKINQWDKMNIFVNAPYVRDAIYSEYFSEPHVPEDMPPMYPSLIGYTLDAANAWANENGVSINWVTIGPSDPGYDESQAGLVVAQDPRKGALIAEYPSCTLTLMGDALPSEDKVPNFVGKSINEAIAWCNNNGISYTATEVENTDPAKSKLVVTQSVSAGTNKHKVNSITFTYYQAVVQQISADVLAGLIGKSKADVDSFCSSHGISNYSFVVDSGATGSCGSITSVSPSSGTSDTAFVFYQAPHNWGDWSAYDENGKRTRSCSICGAPDEETMSCPYGFNVSSQTCNLPPVEPEPPVNPEPPVEPEPQEENPDVPPSPEDQSGGGGDTMFVPRISDFMSKTLLALKDLFNL